MFVFLSDFDQGFEYVFNSGFGLDVIQKDVMFQGGNCELCSVVIGDRVWVCYIVDKIKGLVVYFLYDLLYYLCVSGDVVVYMIIQFYNMGY